MKPVGSISGAYREKLQTKEWKSFSRSMKEQKGNSCEICKRGDMTTEVHHWFYDFDREPWQYMPDEVAVLCSECHREMHTQLRAFRKHVFSKMNAQQFRVLNGALKVGFESYEALTLVHAIGELVSTPSMVDRYAKSWGSLPWRKTDEQIAYEKFRRSLTGDITGEFRKPWACQNCGHHYSKEQRPSIWNGFPFCGPECAKEWDEDSQVAFEELKAKTEESV